MITRSALWKNAKFTDAIEMFIGMGYVGDITTGLSYMVIRLLAEH